MSAVSQVGVRTAISVVCQDDAALTVFIRKSTEARIKFFGFVDPVLK